MAVSALHDRLVRGGGEGEGRVALGFTAGQALSFGASFLEPGDFRERERSSTAGRQRRRCSGPALMVVHEHTSCGGRRLGLWTSAA